MSSTPGMINMFVQMWEKWSRLQVTDYKYKEGSHDSYTDENYLQAVATELVNYLTFCHKYLETSAKIGFSLLLAPAPSAI